MNMGICEEIRAIHPRRDRWTQYSEIIQHFYPLVSTSDMDELCRAVAKRLEL